MMMMMMMMINGSNLIKKSEQQSLTTLVCQKDALVKIKEKDNLHRSASIDDIKYKQTCYV